MSDTVTITITCHCKRNQYSFEVDREELPFKAQLCSCNISRRISGVLFTSYVPVSDRNAAPGRTNLTAYKSSDLLNRHFCTICGTHMFLEYADGHWEVATGLIPDADEILQYQGHMWIADTKDGGAADWINEIRSKTCTRWSKGVQSEELPNGWHAARDPQQQTPDKLHARCHCGGVEFFITRPNEGSLKARSPFPDSVVAFTHDKPPENPDNIPWWISEDGKRYAASNCSCTSCRLLSGFDVVQWAFVPRVNIEGTGGESVEQIGSIKTYESSQGVTRTFCRVCGANVFWEGQFRPTILDVAVGILDADSGARADGWLDWIQTRVSFREEAHHIGLIEGLEQGLKAWQRPS